MVKKRSSELPASMKRCLLEFYRFQKANGGVPPTYAQLGAILKCSGSYARYCLQALGAEGRDYVAMTAGTRYTPWRLTAKGTRLAKQLAKKSKKAAK